MQVLTAVLCDSAADYQGKLCVLGAFDTIWAQKFPAVHAHCSLAMRFLFRDTDLGDHRLEIVFLDADGRNLLPRGPINLNLKVEAIPDRTYFLSRNLVINLQGLPLQMAGQYAFDVKIDSRTIANIPLQAVEAPVAQPPGE